MSGWEADAGKDWDLGFGFALAGAVPFGRALELRGDWGARWLDGDHRVAVSRPTHHDEPRWGGPAGWESASLRVMPATLSLGYRGDRWARGRFWSPYVGFGPGFYDMRATYREPHAGPLADSPPAEWNHDLFRFGWHLRAGAYLYRTSGLYLDLGGAIHFVDVPGEWSPLWEVSLGVGSLLRGSAR
jgi:hypothetical protein